MGHKHSKKTETSFDKFCQKVKDFWPFIATVALVLMPSEYFYECLRLRGWNMFCAGISSLAIAIIGWFMLLLLVLALTPHGHKSRKPHYKAHRRARRRARRKALIQMEKENNAEYNR
jgi:hypothetical protein